MFQLKRERIPAGKLEKRAQSLSHGQVVAWADTYLNDAGKALLAHAREGDRAYLDAAEEAVVALLTLVRELKRR